MRRFRFALEKLLRHREGQEEAAAQALAAAERARTEAAQALARLQDRMAAEATALRIALGHSTRGADFAVHTAFAEGLAARAAVLAARRLAAERGVQERRTVLVERRRAREVVERLRERGLARWREDAAREEQRGLDEAAVGGYLRRARETR